jgi:hypothetical protein
VGLLEVRGACKLPCIHPCGARRGSFIYYAVPQDVEEFMRDQYAADVSDLLKFAFLRVLAAEDRTIGVAWYYNPAYDRRPDGCHREYCDESKWKSLDLAVWNALKELPERSVEALENLPIWPAQTYFHRVPVPPRGSRHSWVLDMKRTLQGCGIAFLDPDNGVGGVSKRHATVEEIKAMRQLGRAVVVIKFPARTKYDIQLREFHEMLRDRTGAVSIVTLRTRVSLRYPSVRWFTIVDADDVLVERAKQFAHKLSGINRCVAAVVCGRWCVDRREDQTMNGAKRRSINLTPESRATEQNRRVENVCPECGRNFKGNGFDGIDAHWRANHEAIMPYKDVWPLVKAGCYRRRRQPHTER